MRNAAKKFALLSARMGEAQAMPERALPAAVRRGGDLGSPRPHQVMDASDLAPLDHLRRFMRKLGEVEHGVVMFGFSDKALLDIMDEEFEADLENGVLAFAKQNLDARSIQLAAGRHENPEARQFTRKEEALIDNLSSWLVEATRLLYRDGVDAAKLEDIRQEYAECIRIYTEKKVLPCDPNGSEVLLRCLFGSAQDMRAFMHAITVDAMFKADAARVIFGDESAYAEAWFRKQVFRHKMCKAVDQYMTSCAT